MASRGEVGRLSLDELIALNEEIAALVRAGVPLERGLVGFGRDLKGRLGRAAEAIGRRMEAGGCTLADAVAAESAAMPELYAAVIEAGARAGRLTAALEGLTELARTRAEVRRTLDLAMLYPAILVALAYGLFVAFVAVLAPRLEVGFRSLGAPAGAAGLLARFGEWAPLWGPIGLAGLGVAAWLWLRSGRASALGAGGPIVAIPGVRGIVAMGRVGLFAELLALLIEQRVPMPEALGLAARAVGDPALRAASGRVAEALRRGEDLATAVPAEAVGPFPPMLRWLILSGAARGDLPRALRAAGRSYRDRAAARAEALRWVVPTALLVVVGGGAVLLYGLTLFVPFTDVLRGIG